MTVHDSVPVLWARAGVDTRVGCPGDRLLDAELADVKFLHQHAYAFTIARLGHQYE